MYCSNVHNCSIKWRRDERILLLCYLIAKLEILKTFTYLLSVLRERSICLRSKTIMMYFVCPHIISIVLGNFNGTNAQFNLLSRKCYLPWHFCFVLLLSSCNCPRPHFHKIEYYICIYTCYVLQWCSIYWRSPQKTSSGALSPQQSRMTGQSMGGVYVQQRKIDIKTQKTYSSALWWIGGRGFWYTLSFDNNIFILRTIPYKMQMNLHNKLANKR